MEKFEYQAYIKIRVLLGIAPVDIWKDPHAIQAHSELSRDTIRAILYVSLKLRKITSRWILYELTDANRKERVACRENLAMLEVAGGDLVI